MTAPSSQLHVRLVQRASGLDPAEIIRRDPLPDADDAEPNYFTTVELASGDPVELTADDVINAAEAGGNTPLTKANEVIEVHGVTITMAMTVQATAGIVRTGSRSRSPASPRSPPTTIVSGLSTLQIAATARPVP